MATLKINADKPLGKIKPMHAGGQPPVISNAQDTFFHYLTEVGVPYSRLHDVNGAFGGGKYVDVPNIFRDFNADVDDPASYDFTFTDLLLAQLHKAGVEPYYRLGVTIENAGAVKQLWVKPPEDMEKWASVCEHIVRHYNEGWADGFHYGITYWEIWGEPDNPPYLWTFEKEEYFRLYATTAKLLKEKHPSIKVGAYGCTGFYRIWKENPEMTPMEQYRVDFFHEFFDYVTKEKAPIDFFSWHSYMDTKSTVSVDKWIHGELVKMGYGDLETHLNEWDPFASEFGTAHHAAEMAAMMISMQYGYPALCCIYDLRIANAPYCPLFNPITFKPVQGWYTFAAFNTLYKLGTQVEAVSDTEDLYALAAVGEKGGALLVSNLTGKAQELTIEGVDLSRARIHVIDNERLLSWTPALGTVQNNEVYLIEW